MLLCLILLFKWVYEQFIFGKIRCKICLDDNSWWNWQYFDVHGWMVFAFLKWWIMGFDISCLATTGNFTQWLQGGGLYLSSSSSATITGSTISHNTAVRDVWCVSLMWNAMKLTKFWYAWVNGVLSFWNDGWWDATFLVWQLLVISSWLRCHWFW